MPLDSPLGIQDAIATLKFVAFIWALYVGPRLGFAWGRRHGGQGITGSAFGGIVAGVSAGVLGAIPPDHEMRDFGLVPAFIINVFCSANLGAVSGLVVGLAAWSWLTRIIQTTPA